MYILLSRLGHVHRIENGRIPKDLLNGEISEEQQTKRMPIYIKRCMQEEFGGPKH